MPKGIGIVIVFSILGLALNWMMSSGHPVGVTKQQVAQLKGINALQLETLNQSRQEFKRLFGRPIENPLELVGPIIEKFPKEAFSRSSYIVSEFDGRGGWVFSRGNFSVNHSEKAGDYDNLHPTPTVGPQPTPQPDVAKRLEQWNRD